MLRIRLQRTGRRNRAHYRLVLAEKSASVKGKFIERLGSYNPHTKKIGLEKDRILKWLGHGAQPSNTVARLLTKEGLKHKLVVVKLRQPRAVKSQATAKPVTQKEAPNQTPEATSEISETPTTDEQGTKEAAAGEPSDDAQGKPEPTS